MKQLFADKRLLNYHQRHARLKLFTSLFFALLFVPLCTIFYIGYSQFEKETIAEYQRSTETISEQLYRRMFKRAALANAIPVADFDYYQTLYNPLTKQESKILSPLSSQENMERFKGHLGYFQIDNQGRFNSPVWPHLVGEEKERINETTGDADGALRKGMAERLYGVIKSANYITELIGKASPSSHNKFDLNADSKDYYIYHRAVNVAGQVKIQGYVLNRDAYLTQLILDVLDILKLDIPIALTVTSPFPEDAPRYFVSNVSKAGELVLSQPKQLDPQLQQVYLHTKSIYWPYKGYEIAYSTSALPLTSAALYSIGLFIVLLVATLIGCYGFYYIGVKQLKLAEQRLNFVSSVSHELKTPLTSIRMYSEMLKSGMVLSEKHQAEYYDFIFSESERLSRLIDNILQLAKLSQPQHNVNPEFVRLDVLIDNIRSKISSMLSNGGFELNLVNDVTDSEKAMLWVDADAFAQVIINLTDNAIKFFDEDEIGDDFRKKLDFVFSGRESQNEQIKLTVRDYGLGITAEQESKIFELFYRGGNELTRSTQGTGIGLALVHELMSAQQAEIGVRRMKPGLAIDMLFKAKYSQ